jgi:hypothetical protein
LIEVDGGIEGYVRAGKIELAIDTPIQLGGNSRQMDHVEIIAAHELKGHSSPEGRCPITLPANRAGGTFVENGSGSRRHGNNSCLNGDGSEKRNQWKACKHGCGLV